MSRRISLVGSDLQHLIGSPRRRFFDKLLSHHANQVSASTLAIDIRNI